MSLAWCFFYAQKQFHKQGQFTWTVLFFIFIYQKGWIIMKNWKAWLKAAGVRAIRTIAQTAVASIGTSAAMGQVDWLFVASTSALAGIVSLLTSVTGLPEIKEEVKEGE